RRPAEMRSGNMPSTPATALKEIELAYSCGQDAGCDDGERWLMVSLRAERSGRPPIGSSGSTPARADGDCALTCSVRRRSKRRRADGHAGGASLHGIARRHLHHPTMAEGLNVLFANAPLPKSPS